MTTATAAPTPIVRLVEVKGTCHNPACRGTWRVVTDRPNPHQLCRWCGSDDTTEQEVEDE
jgi:hypothetical protein